MNAEASLHLRASLEATLSSSLDNDHWFAERDGLSEQMRRAAWTNVAIYGAGGLGRKTMNGLRALGIFPIAIGDGSPVMQGRHFDGLTVLSPDNFARTVGANVKVIVCITDLGEKTSFETVSNGLIALGCTNVVSYLSLFQEFSEQFLPYSRFDRPSKILANKDLILSTFDLWSDDRSRELFVQQVAFLLDPLGASCTRSIDSGDSYFPIELVELTDHETFIDCGAFDGDSARTFLKMCGSLFKAIHAFEPDPANHHKLTEWRAHLAQGVKNRVHIHPIALGDRKQLLKMEALGTPGSSLVHGQTGSVQCVRLDDYLESEVTYIKLDVEGAEPAALEGARNTLRNYQPKVAVSIYHFQDHIWSVPLRLAHLLPNHHYFLRRHSTGIDDVVCYALPC